MYLFSNKIFKKFIKFVFLAVRPILFRISMRKCTHFQYLCLKLLGVDFKGHPKYLSAKIWFDGADYSKIHIGNRVTISSNIRILTHDWALDTIIEGFNYNNIKRPIGKLKDIEIGDHSFIGTGSIIMPGVKIGKCCIIGAGTIVRGNVPDYSICIGNPSLILEERTDTYLDRFLEKHHH